MSKLVICDKASMVEELIHHCQTTRFCSFDFETTGFEYYQDFQYPLITGVSFQPGSSWILPMGHKDSPFKKTWKKHFRLFGEQVLENRDIVKVAWNFKFEYKWCMAMDIIPRGRLFDAMLAKYCLDEEMPHDLKNFVSNFFPKYAGYEKNLRTISETGELERVDWKNTPFDKLCTYCGLDSDLTGRGMIYMEPKLIKLGFYNLFRNMLMGIMKALAEAEYRGMLIDRAYLVDLVEKYKVKIAEADKGLRNAPAVLKFQKKIQKHNLQQLIKETQLEITKLTSEDAKKNARLIFNREQKIKSFLEGKVTNNKERKLLEPVNFASPDQMRTFLYSKMGLRLPIIKYTKDKKTKQSTDKASTDEDTLKILQKKDKSGFIDRLLDYRGITKLNSTYIAGMLPHLDKYNRVHANFRINGTVTGRLSCVTPNLQNIPRGTTSADIKRMFIPPPGYVLLEVDYSQAELRIVAELSDDAAMIEIFRKNYNIHVATACKMSCKGLKVYDKVKGILSKADMMSADEIALPKNKKYLKWAKLKKRGKSMNFSIVYQQGDPATAEQMEVSIEQAREFKKGWFHQFPSVKKWIDNQKRLAHKKEYVYNMFGGKRRLHDANCGVGFFEAEAERQAVNAPVQGSSGYFTLFAIIITREEQMKGTLPKDMMLGYTVHDSIGWYVKPKDIHKVVKPIQKICENPQTMKYFGFEMKKVVMKTSAEAGEHWAALKDYDAWENYEKLLIKPQATIK